MLSEAKLNTATALDVRAGLERRDIKSEDVVRDCLSRIALRDLRVGAWEHVAATASIVAAKKLDRDGHPGVLAGVPVAVKDVIDTKDMPTTYGSPLYAGHCPAGNAAVVSRLRDSGAIILGKTVSTEFAYLRPPRTVNPLDLKRTPGGSSSGSAAAVADYMAPIAIGTQTAGSTIRPAAFCGIVGFKPTYGAIAMPGVRPLAESLDTIGIFARTVGDVALASRALMDNPGDVIPASPKFRFSFATSPVLSRIYPAAYSFIPLIKDRLTSNGVQWEDRHRLPGYEEWSRLHYTILSFEASRNFTALVDDNPLAIGSELRTLVEAGSAVSQSMYQRAQADAESQRKSFDASLEDGEILLAPASPGEAPLQHEGTGNPIFNSAWTLLHASCLTLPVVHGAGQMPLGLQLIAHRGADQHLLAAAKFLAGILSDSPTSA